MPMPLIIEPPRSETPPPPQRIATPLERVVVILNASAGALRRDPLEATALIRRGLREAGIEGEVLLCQPRSVTTTVATVAARGDVDAVLVGGGDGTLSAAVHHLAGRKTALGILPLGTVNLLARDLGLPLRLEAALEVALSGLTRVIDVGEVNGRRYAMHASVGLYPWIIRRRDRKPIVTRMGKVTAWLSLLPRALLTAPTFSAELSHERGVETIRTHLLMVSVGPTANGIGPLLRRAELDSGELVAYHARRTEKRALLKLALRAAAGPWPASNDIESTHSRMLTVSSSHKTLPVALDGEVASMTTPLRFRVLPRALTVLAPDPRHL